MSGQDAVSSSSSETSSPSKPFYQLRDAAVKLQQALELYEAQDGNPQWEAKLNEMQVHLKQAVDEKNHWMKKYRELELNRGIDRNSFETEDLVGAMDTRGIVGSPRATDQRPDRKWLLGLDSESWL